MDNSGTAASAKTHPQKGDFVKISYTGIEAATGHVFDTTSDVDAKQFGVFDEKAKYGPALAVYGHGQLMRGIENALGTMSEGQKVELRLEASDAFGEKKKELVRVVPINTFRKNNMDPQPGMMFEIDGMMAHIKSVTSGRVLVDFNHPLAGEKIDYALKLDRIISKPIEKVAALMELNNVKSEATIDGKKLSLVFKEAENEQEYQMKKKLLMDGIKEFVPEIEEIDVKESFKSVKSEPKKEAAGAAGTSSAPAAKK